VVKPDLLFNPADDQTEIVAPDHFRLYVQDDHYRLPHVFIRSVQKPIQVYDVLLAEADPKTGALAHFLARSYPTESWRAQWIKDACDVSKPLLLPASLLRLPGSADLIASVRVVWRVTYEADRVETIDVPLRLEFAPSGAVRDHGIQATPQFPGRIATASVRQDSPNGVVAKTFAIDFGTSSSTITAARDSHVVEMELDSDQDKRLCQGFSALLRSEGPDDPGSRTLWSRLLDELVSGIAEKTAKHPAYAGRSFRTPAELADQLLGRPDGSSVDSYHRRLRDLLVVRLNVGLAVPDERLGAWLAGQLHSIYNEAFFTVALGTSKIGRVELVNASDDVYTLDSVAYVRHRGGVPPEVTLGRLGVNESSSVAGTERGLKRILARPSPLADNVANLAWSPAPQASAGKEFLLMHAYKWLVERALKEEAANSSNPDDVRNPSRVIVTYPTTTTPDRRTRLKAMFKYELKIPSAEFDWDEGTAAAMYFVLRELRGSVREGIERFRSRGRAMSDGSATIWRRTLLVIDIGGGTTDIALLALDLVDQTPPGLHSSSGRSYLIRPQVLGTTGHPQLGGDLLTLRVFYWLKASLIDGLVANLTDAQRAERHGRWPGASSAADGGYRPLAPILLDNESLDPVPQRVFEALQALLPTDERTCHDRQPFETLWEHAEQAKRTLGKADRPTFGLAPSEIEPALRSIPSGGPSLTGLGLKVPKLEFTVGDFARIVRPVIRKAGALAADLVKVRLRDLPGESLDQIVFSGRSAQMPLVPQIVGQVMAERLDTESDSARVGTMSWHPSAMVVETTYAKQATSLGAIWASELKALTASGAEKADNVKRVSRGDSVIALDSGSMFLSLPCGFHLRESEGGRGLALLSAGSPCRFSDAAGNLAARSVWHLMPPDIRVHRDLGDDTSIEWGELQFHMLAHAAGKTGVDLDPQPPADLHFQVQIDQDLVPMIFLCRGGRPQFLAHESADDISGYLPKNWLTSAAGTQAPFWIQVTDAAGKMDAAGVGRDIFGVRQSGPAPRLVHSMATLEPGAEPEPTMITDVALPDPDRSGPRPRWIFSGMDAAGNVYPIAEVPVPIMGDHPARYYASLDRLGRLRVHMGYPRYLSTNRIADMLTHTGVVYHASLPPGDRMWDEHWNPFNGGH
jgi:hypothetical protein